MPKNAAIFAVYRRYFGCYLVAKRLAGGWEFFLSD
jgi:hypothetical protein